MSSNTILRRTLSSRRLMICCDPGEFWLFAFRILTALLRNSQEPAGNGSLRRSTFACTRWTLFHNSWFEGVSRFSLRGRLEGIRAISGLRFFVPGSRGRLILRQTGLQILTSSFDSRLRQFIKTASGTALGRSYSKSEQCLSIGSYRDGCRSGEKKPSWRCSRGNQYPRSAGKSVLRLQSKEEGLDEERARMERF